MNIVRNSLASLPTPMSFYFILLKIHYKRKILCVLKLQTIDNSLMAVGKKRKKRKREENTREQNSPTRRESLFFSSSKLFKYASASQPHRHYFTLLRAMANETSL